jgi:hypothetical protein
MKNNQTILNNKLTHIMGNTGTGKTYFAKNAIEEIIESGKSVIYVSIFDDIVIDSNLLEKIFIKNEDEIKNVNITNKNLHVVFDRKTIGEEESNALANKFITLNIEQNKLSENIYLILDDMQIYQDNILEKVLKSNSNIVLIHQYIQQLSDEIQHLVLDKCETGIYFNMPKSNIDTIKLYYKENDVNKINSIEKLNEHEYVVLDKKTVEDKKSIKDILNIYFEGVSDRDIEKIKSVIAENTMFIFYEDKNFIKEDFITNLEKIKFEGENSIKEININEDWGYVHCTGQMILENQDQKFYKMMITLRKNSKGWIITCVQNMQEDN